MVALKTRHLRGASQPLRARERLEKCSGKVQIGDRCPWNDGIKLAPALQTCIAAQLSCTSNCVRTAGSFHSTVHRIVFRSAQHTHTAGCSSQRGGRGSAKSLECIHAHVWYSKQGCIHWTCAVFGSVGAVRPCKCMYTHWWGALDMLDEV